jgi:3-methyladenine DNA glycosylase/8-oxoguanine DNA glycosylase
MVGEVCPGDGDMFTFSTPERLAAVSEDDLRKARLGFRARAAWFWLTMMPS